MPKKKSAAKTSIPVEAIKHGDTRKNIPTEQLRDFMPEQPVAPKLYPRDASLDPQLVWKGKDEQDAKPLEVPVVPIYIQEKIHPQAIIEDLKARAIERSRSRQTSGDGESGGPRSGDIGYKQLDLFADFNGIDTFDKKVDFYHHDQHWSNRMILGDSLAVMTSLAEKEGLKGQVQTIYFDPPYGIKFGSNWQVSTRQRDVKDGKAEDAAARTGASLPRHVSAASTDHPHRRAAVANARTVQPPSPRSVTSVHSTSDNTHSTATDNSGA